MARRGSLAARLAAALLVVFAVAGAAAPAPPSGVASGAYVPPASEQGWVGSWATAPVQEDDGQWRLENQSLRMIAHLSLGGSTLRVRLSNAYGTAPLTFTQVRLARRTSGPAVDPASDRPVRFAGSTRVTVPAGRDVLSDPVRLDVRAGSDVAVSMHVASTPGGSTRHPMALATQYASPAGSGDVTADASGAGFSLPMQTTYFLTGIDVRSADAHAVVALGDSITDGSSSQPDTNGRWPDVLARRLAGRGVGVLNAGISANTVTRSGKSSGGPGGGEPAVLRFTRDVLGQSGVRAVVLFEGTNDLSAGVSARELVDGLRLLALRARRAGLTVVGATVLPRACGGAWTGPAEEQRQALNHWIRTAGEFAAVADLDTALRDPQRPTCLDPRYDSGDGLHPNQQGMERIAEAVPLEPLGG